MLASQFPIFDGTEPIDERLELDSSIIDKAEQYKAALYNYFHPY